MFVLGQHELEFQSSYYAFECSKGVPVNCTKIAKTNWLSPLHRLVITSQLKYAIFSHRIRWVVSMGLKHHETMQKQRYQHLKALLFHFMQFCGPCFRHKKWHSSTIRLSFKITQNSMSFNICFHFLSAVSLGSRASKISEKFTTTTTIQYTVCWWW